jgi:hypothetical protein
MPEVTKTFEVEKMSEVEKPKTQPWRAIWPLPESAASRQIERKANCGSGGDTGGYGYNDDNEGIASDPPKK